jgi:hypothetical protein
MPENCDEVYQELFNAKKYQYNDEHDIRIGGHDVELYVQPSDQPHVSAGVYSLKNNDWVHIPRKIAARVDDESVRNKYEDIKARIESALKSNNIDRMRQLWDKIKDMRKAGLAQNGELGPENLAFKMLRTQGDLGKLKDTIRRARDAELSLDEQRKKKKKPRVKYGFGGYWYPGFGFGSSESGDAGGGDGGESQYREDVTLTPDGVSASTKMFLSEKDIPSTTEIIFDFMRFAVHELELQNVPTLKIKKDPQWSVIHKSFGRYRDDLGQIDLAVGNRHIMDVLRTLAHELQHRKQDEREHMPPGAGDTGSRFENEAHAVAGVLMRKYADMHPEYFEDTPVSESASGYIPTAKEKNDPRYKMALTRDIKPGQIGKEANKIKLGTDSQGKPSLIYKSANRINEALVHRSYVGSSEPLWNIRDNNRRLRYRRNEVIIADAKPRKENVPMPSRTRDKDYRQKMGSFVGHHYIYIDGKLAQRLPSNTGPGRMLKWAGSKFVYADTGDLFVQADFVHFTPDRGVIAYDIPGSVQTPGPSVTVALEQQGMGNQEAVGESRNDGNDPPGPEFRPTMPRGTVRVDVSDMYDWYKLGKNIANLKKANPKDFGKGPPSTIVSFGDEETEHKYIKDLEKLGLTTTDIDPVDPNRPKGMPRQKVDPTYNVAENEIAKRLREELELFEEQDLFEIRMATSNLRQEAAKTGAIAGMEFEMIVPNVEGDANDYDSEPNYDMDQRCRSIQDAYDFFYDGDHNSRRDVDRLREKMREDYLEWLDEKIADDWERNGDDYITDWVKNNVDESEWNPDDLAGDARNEALEEYSANVHADPVSRDYQSAYDEFREENQESWDESDWLDAEDLDLMSYVENAYMINWPYWYESSGGGEANIEDVANDFENAIGRDVRASGNYHSGSVIRPSPTQIRYVVEPDGSLEPDNSGDRGLEFVSPPLPIDEILSDLNKVKAWAKEYGCYTNDSTGLHINISVPNYSRENLDFVKLALLMGDKYVLDAFGRSGNTYAKSALGIIKDAVRNKPEDAARLLDKMKGNLDQLATKAIHSGITQKYTSINTKDGHIEFRSPGGDWLDENFDKIENTLLRFTVAMSAALNPDAYRQEYLTKLYKLLSENNQDDDVIKYFSDYVAGKIPQAALRSFVKQVQLQRKIKRGKTGDQKMWWKVYKEGKAARNGAAMEVVATGEKEAIDKAAAEWGLFSQEYKNQMDAEVLRPYDEKADQDNSTNPLRPTGPGPWEVYNRQTGNSTVNLVQGGQPITDRAEAQQLAMNLIVPERHDLYGVRTRDTGNTINIGSQTDMENRLGWGRQADDANYEIVDRRTLQPVFRYIANTPAEANIKYGQWLAAVGAPGTTENYGFREIRPQIPEVPLDIEQNFPQDRTDGRTINFGNQFSGQWKVMVNGQEVWRFRGVGNNQADANRIAAQWLRDNGMGVSGEGYEVVPVMI